MEKLEQQLSRLESKIPEIDIINTAISSSTVGWQIAHTLLTFNFIVSTLEKSKEENYKWKFNFMRTLVFTLNKLPRGKAKAPKMVQPENSITIESLKENLILAKNNLEIMKNLKSNNHIPHPYFGELNLKQTIRFLRIHNNHHLNIIEDIIK
ncbi:DUF1569 domain-containing protein [Flavobacterium sp. 7A]|uniref:DUF1569 domain-containing protein n=1 Tax=Flavobacterium sp. 7A TaxID=2940571 RepID=UPI0022262711|nr:DUF1569 domain-containing protein [Flavobacterium sp. 7A]MCW2120031.1 hypothetical protein [Flavobacterium sp. 7A]